MRATTLISSILAFAQISLSGPSGTPVEAYRGEDMTVAILDCGFTFTHEIFALEDASPRITKEISDSLLAETSIADNEDAPASVYVNPKIPFAYDYGDNDSDLSQANYNYHGTAMISITAGNGSFSELNIPALTGVAPEAQVLAMKVYSDTLGAVTEAAMCAAIEDSITLGADVILIALTDMYELEEGASIESINALIEKAESEGIIVVTAAGNASSYGTGSIFDRELAISFPTTDNPDVGTITWPGNIESTLCVTSAVNNILENDSFILSDGSRIPYSDSNSLFTDITNGKSFASYFNGRTLEYVMTDGIGTPEELAAAGDLTGKLAVINRGNITFTQKAVNAASLGAIGVIVVDNVTDASSTLTMSMDLTGTTIPAIIVSKDDGALLAACKNKSITVKAGEIFETKLRETPSIAENTAYGTTSELGLKPDLAAVGTNVCCAATDGTYGYLTSTTAAAARVAGMSLLVKERFADVFPSIEKSDLVSITKAALVTSADLMAPTYSPAYSPRIQGGGAANLESAMNTGLLLLSGDSYKIELGDNNERTLDFEITAYNLSRLKRTFKLDAIVGSDDFTEFPAMLLDSPGSKNPLSKRLGYEASDTLSFILPFTPFKNADVAVEGESSQLNAASDNYTAHRFVLEANSSKTFNIKITLDEETYNIYREQFENGFFIEGFMRLSAGNDTASIPFLGFSGDFGASPSLDADIYSGKQAIYENSYLYLDSGELLSDPYMNILGRTMGNSSVSYDKERIVFSPVSAGTDSSVMLNLALLRSVYDVTVTVSDSSGKTISTAKHGDLTRTYYDYLSEQLISPKLYIWNGRAEDNSVYIYPEGDYTVTVSYRPAGSEETDTISYKLSLDSTAPVIETAELISEGEKTLLKLEVTDNYGVGTILVCDSDEENAAFSGNGTYDVSELTGKYIYVDVCDTAQNSTVIRLDNPNYTESDD
ncbi:MAG: S8 family serine peptidase [Clostridia bacterium]|nr:S8 family serine peptidase [Clostridia bacterium]